MFNTFFLDDSVQEMLRFHAEKGDIQTAVSILIVLGKKINFPLAEKSKWVIGYIGKKFSQSIIFCSS